MDMKSKEIIITARDLFENITDREMEEKGQICAWLN